MNATTSVLTVIAVCLSVTLGCKEDDASTTKTPSTLATRPTAGGLSPAAAGDKPPVVIPGENLDIPAVLNAGGVNWSSSEQAEVGGRSLKAGKDYWFWPAEDTVYSPQTHDRGDLVIRLNWRLRKGGVALTDGKVYGTVIAAWPDGPVHEREVAGDFDGTAPGGVLRLTYPQWKRKGGGDVTVYLSKPGSPDPLSNLLRLKVSAARP